MGIDAADARKCESILNAVCGSICDGCPLVELVKDAWIAFKRHQQIVPVTSNLETIGILLRDFPAGAQAIIVLAIGTSCLISFSNEKQVLVTVSITFSTPDVVADSEAEDIVTKVCAEKGAGPHQKLSTQLM